MRFALQQPEAVTGLASWSRRMVESVITMNKKTLWSTPEIARLTGVSAHHMNTQVDRCKIGHYWRGGQRWVPTQCLIDYLKNFELWESIPPVVRYLVGLQEMEKTDDQRC